MTASLPLFYSNPVPLSATAHKNLGVKNSEAGIFGFASKTNSVPLNAVEFVLASRNYPIVFIGNDENLFPSVVLGLTNNENLFVDEDGRWEPDTYIPAYLRRYPFIFMEDKEGLQLVLCVDMDAPMVAEKGGQKLFAGGKPSAITEQALMFCQDYQSHHLITQAFCKAVQKAGLLVSNRADVTMNSGTTMSLSGFQIIDEAKFNRLSDETFLEWRQKGWLQLVFSHLISQSNWTQLVNRKAAAKTFNKAA